MWGCCRIRPFRVKNRSIGSRICSLNSRRVIVSTPNARYLREAHDTLVGFNPLEAHLSEVPRSLLADRGYKVLGAGFGRYDSRLAMTAKRFRLRTSLWSTTRRVPRFAETIVAFKDVG